ncbi:MAG: glycoside hydrolase family 88 protein [Armatimonadota bacterium]
MQWKRIAAAGFAALSSLGLCLAARADAKAELKAFEGKIEAVAKLPGEPSIYESAGVTRVQDLPLRTLGSREPVSSSRRRLVLIGGLDGNDRGADAAVAALRWFKTQAPQSLRDSWSITAMPLGNPEGWLELKPTNDSGGKPAVNYPPAEGTFFADRKNAEGRYIWRWITFQAPDLVLEIRGGNRIAWFAPPNTGALAQAVGAQPLVGADSLAMSLTRDPVSGLGTVPVLLADSPATGGPEVLQKALVAAASLPRSPLRQAVIRRSERAPLTAASLLAERYPRENGISYIPAAAWSGALRLAELRGESPEATRLREKVRLALAPYLNGAAPVVNGEPDVAKLAGYLVFADLAEAAGTGDQREAAKRLALEGAALFRPEGSGGTARFGRFWSDDMFMTAAVLGRAGKLSGDAAYFDLLGRTLRQYVEKLQQPSGLFIHAPDAPHAWGRGNGFAALGLMEALTYLPEGHADRAPLLASFRKLIAALVPLQAPEGTWRQVVDRPESYREVTATAMTLAAMARGIRMGWLGKELAPVAARAWSGLAARLGDDGSLIDVCAGTGTGPTLRYYYDRPALAGPDDRGGAMALLAAVEYGSLGN